MKRPFRSVFRDMERETPRIRRINAILPSFYSLATCFYLPVPVNIFSSKVMEGWPRTLFFPLPWFSQAFASEGIRSGFVDASMTSGPGSRHTWEKGCCLSWQPLRRGGRGDLIGCQNFSLWKSQPDGGRVEKRKKKVCQWKLNHLSSFPLLATGGSPPPPPQSTAGGNYIGQRVG